MPTSPFVVGASKASKGLLSRGSSRARQEWADGSQEKAGQEAPPADRPARVGRLDERSWTGTLCRSVLGSLTGSFLFGEPPGGLDLGLLSRSHHLTNSRMGANCP